MRTVKQENCDLLIQQELDVNNIQTLKKRKEIDLNDEGCLSDS